MSAQPFSIDRFSGNQKDFRQGKVLARPQNLSDLCEMNPKYPQKIDLDRESQIAWSDEESVHTEWSESNVWSDEDEEDGIDKGKHSTSLNMNLIL